MSCMVDIFNQSLYIRIAKKIFVIITITKDHIYQPVYNLQAVLALSNYIMEFCF